jgi:hypothetical protein
MRLNLASEGNRLPRRNCADFRMSEESRPAKHTLVLREACISSHLERPIHATRNS